MIHQLTEGWERIRPLFYEHSRQPVLNGILAGNNKGRIFVDSPDRPACALVWAEQEIFYLMGEPKETFVFALPAWIREVIAPEAERIADPFFQVELMPEVKWRPIVERGLQEFIPKPYDRVTFTFDPKRYRKLPPVSVPADVRVERITREMLAEDSFAEVRDHIADFWISPEIFIENGFGYAVLVGDEVVCSCLTAFGNETDVEIGINTYSRTHRGKGYAQLAARSFLDECLHQNRTPHWKTEDFRLPSIKLAEKVGFTNRRLYKAYMFLYNELDNLVFTAYHRLRYFKDLAEAKRFLDRACAYGDLKNWHHFLLACGYSLAGETESSLKHMERALELGWDHVSDLRYDMDLIHLRKTERGRALLEEFEKGLG
ncbi:hypothetical protein GCM10007416_08000 [Kroppenstedtia guangzhouensis]|uniref:N-acetyltransferase domain-containing protein n=1 Tax=Kroppenstedtia guangzhouensis TaxID=1274356 RepID=A0ABQ1G636_9BACL|nr:GNAT family N-acetyltransferase [Kroppenstedtia guangzhouensis]GGA37485.1 hypothetical protein GCM10007416_08000 [Kroppenstedtia guangzhouensis]